MAQAPQRTISEYGVDNPPDSFFGLIGYWLRDIGEQQIDGSIVILIILAMASPWIFQLIKAWIGRGPRQ